MVISKKEKKMCEGRLIVTDFKKLNPADFDPLYHFDSKSEFTEEIILQSIKGVIYINSRDDISEFLSEIFSFLMKQSITALKNYLRQLKSKYPSVKNFEDWAKIAEREGFGSEDSVQSLIKLLIPIERKRRKMELDYYGLSQNERI